jgi:hypothetical protein
MMAILFYYKRLIHDTFFANAKVPELAGRDGGG